MLPCSGSKISGDDDQWEEAPEGVCYLAQGARSVVMTFLCLSERETVDQ